MTAALASRRLVTLVGMGGAGKTRLAIEVARVATGHDGGAWFVDLSAAESVEAMCRSCAEVLGLKLAPGEAAAELARGVARRGRILLVLDNLEQGIAGAREVVARLRSDAPDATLLCTSRLAVRVADEHCVPVGPLSEDDAVALFRARSAVGIDPHLDAVRDIVRLVGAHPLALELAAARTRLLPLPEIRRRIEGSLAILGDRDRPDRHRSIDALVGGSLELVSEEARVAFAELAVFAGGFTLEAAEAVLDPPPHVLAIDVLQELVDGHLVLLTADRARFTLHALAHRCAVERLRSKERARAEARHGAWFAQHRGRAAELDNLVVAARRAAALGDDTVAAPCALAAAEVYVNTGPLLAGAELLGAVLPVLRDPRVAARLASERARLLQLGGRLDTARRELEDVVARCEAGPEQGAALLRLASVLREQGRPDEARPRYVAAAEVARRADDTALLAHALGGLGILESETGNPEEARRRHEEALELNRRAGRRSSEAVNLSSLGLLDSALGRPEDAERYLLASAAIHRELGQRRSEAMVIGNLANLLRDAGRTDDAVAGYAQAVAVFRDLGDRRNEAIVLLNQAAVLRDAGRREEALAGVLAARQRFAELGDRRSEAVAVGHVGISLTALGRLDEARVALQLAEEGVRGVRDRVSLVEVVSARGMLALASGDDAGARAALVEAQELLAELGVPGHGRVRGPVQALAQALQIGGP